MHSRHTLGRILPSIATQHNEKMTINHPGLFTRQLARERNNTIQRIDGKHFKNDFESQSGA